MVRTSGPRNAITIIDIHNHNLRDISVHMCFWGLLSLANERGLTIRGQESMNELVIQGAS